MATPNPIDAAFAQDAGLRKRIYNAMAETPHQASLFVDIAHYHLAHGANGVAGDEPATKKRKLNGVGSGAAPSDLGPRIEIFEVKDVSFSLPQRKKLTFGIVQYGAEFGTAGVRFGVYTKSPATGQVDMEAWLDDYGHAFRLPVPEKTAKQYNFVLLPRPTSQQEPIIFTIPHGPLKSFSINSPELRTAAPTPDGALEAAFRAVLGRCKHGISLALPTEAEFASATPEPHRKGEKAYHVKAFRGSKDGFLFFLAHGILFGFKKPLIFFAFADVISVSYTSVLQRTFNLNICYRDSDGTTATADDDDDEHQQQEIEFSMLDQADFPGIDAYIKRHGLQDASLAESRKARRAEVKQGRGAKGGDEDTAAGAAAGDDNDGMTELERAQQQLEDEEDEEEEDYAPSDEDDGSESGGGSDDDSDEEGEKKTKPRAGRDLVADELGSEAEDVSITDEEEEHEGRGGDEGDDEGEEEEEEEVEEEYDEEDEEEEGDEGEDEDQQPLKHSGFQGVAANRKPTGSGGFQALNTAPQARPGGFTSMNAGPVTVPRWESDMPAPDDEDQL